MGMRDDLKEEALFFTRYCCHAVALAVVVAVVAAVVTALLPLLMLLLRCYCC